MRYFLYGYYGFGNFGDDLLLHSLIAGIRRSDPAAQFVVRSRGTVAELAADPAIRFSGIEQRLEGLSGRLSKLCMALAELRRRIDACEVFVIGGGTLFIDKGQLNLSLLLLALAVKYAKWRGRRVVVTGVAVDLLTHPLSLALTRSILGSADFVAVRDAISLPYAEHRRQTDRPALLAADMVLSLPLPPVAPQACDDGRPVLGFCFIDYYRTLTRYPERHPAYVAAILRLLAAHRQQYRLLCITFQQGQGQRDDWLQPLLVEHFPEVRTLHVDSLAQVAALGGVDVLLTTRFHLGILGVMLGKPVIVIDHELKMTALANDFALPTLSLVEFVAGADCHVDALLNEYNPARTAASLAQQRQRVAHNFAWFDGEGEKQDSKWP